MLCADKIITLDKNSWSLLYKDMKRKKDYQERKKKHIRIRKKPHIEDYARNKRWPKWNEEEEDEEDEEKQDSMNKSLLWQYYY